ncbi:hypothetical protein E4U61_007383 [Claviceps capensis]|nr:hypothetical protein E4U61_007383 [Claviceps capensis]
MDFQCDQREREESARAAARQNLIGLSFSFFGGAAVHSMFGKLTKRLPGRISLSVTIRFVTLVRQSDRDASSIAFRRVFEDMREGNPELTDFRTLQPRLLSTFERRERTSFEEQAVCVFDMNYLRLREANIPVLLLRARHSDPRHASISRKGFNDLTAELLLTIGARGMLTANMVS